MLIKCCVCRALSQSLRAVGVCLLSELTCTQSHSTVLTDMLGNVVIASRELDDREDVTKWKYRNYKNIFLPYLYRCPHLLINLPIVVSLSAAIV